MRIEETYRLYDPQWMPKDIAGALLPGDKAGLDVHGFAVSAGTTSHPELAYEMAKYLTFRPEPASLYPLAPGTAELSDDFARYRRSSSR